MHNRQYLRRKEWKLVSILNTEWWINLFPTKCFIQVVPATLLHCVSMFLAGAGTLCTHFSKYYEEINILIEIHSTDFYHLSRYVWTTRKERTAITHKHEGRRSWNCIACNVINNLGQCDTSCDIDFKPMVDTYTSHKAGWSAFSSTFLKVSSLENYVRSRDAKLIYVSKEILLRWNTVTGIFDSVHCLLDILRDGTSTIKHWGTVTRNEWTEFRYTVI